MKHLDYVDHTFRIRYAETDQMGVVHNATYLIWFEMGRTEFSIARNYPYSRLEENDVILVVAESRVRYKKPSYYDEKVTVRTAVAKLSKRVVTFNYQIIRPGTEEIIAEGETVHVALNKNTYKPARIPEEAMKKLAPNISDEDE